MKRLLLGILFLAAFGMALAGPPVDYQLYCEGDAITGEPIGEPIGVLSVTEDAMHVALEEGAECANAVLFVVVPEGESVVTVAVLDWTTDPPTVTETIETTEGEPETIDDIDLVEVPAVAIEGKLGAMQNRAEAFQRAEEARSRSEERAGGPPFDVPVGDDDLEGEEDEEDEDVDGMGVAGSRRH